MANRFKVETMNSVWTARSEHANADDAIAAAEALTLTTDDVMVRVVDTQDLDMMRRPTTVAWFSFNERRGTWTRIK